MLPVLEAVEQVQLHLLVRRRDYYGWRVYPPYYSASQHHPFQSRRLELEWKLGSQHCHHFCWCETTTHGSSRRVAASDSRFPHLLYPVRPADSRRNLTPPRSLSSLLSLPLLSLHLHCHPSLGSLHLSRHPLPWVWEQHMAKTVRLLHEMPRAAPPCRLWENRLQDADSRFLRRIDSP